MRDLPNTTALQRMIQRLASVWIAIGSAAVVACSCYALAGEAVRPLLLISKVFYPGSMLVYFYPLVLGIWALAHTVKSPDNRDQSLLIITTTLGISVIFIAMFALALGLPYIPGAQSVVP